MQLPIDPELDSTGNAYRTEMPIWMRTLVLVLLHWFASVCGHAQEPPLRFVVIGDIDTRDSNTTAVAKLLKDYAAEPVDPSQPQGAKKALDFIIVVGDLNYRKEIAEYRQVAKLFPGYVRKPEDHPKDEELRFFPAVGNHEYSYKGDRYDPDRFKMYEECFAVPAGDGGVHYYDFRRGPVHFFALDSNVVTTVKGGKTVKVWDGSEPGSKQHTWFTSRLAEVKQDPAVRWRIAFFHHPVAHSSTEHKDQPKPMAEWKLQEQGISAVFSGHVHLYERLEFGGVPFFTVGCGGTGLAPFRKDPVEGSQFRYPEKLPSKPKPEHFGALFCEATPDALRFEFRNGKNKVLDAWPK